jgi:hypothetical protein
MKFLPSEDYVRSFTTKFRNRCQIMKKNFRHYNLIMINMFLPFMNIFMPYLKTRSEQNLYLFIFVMKASGKVLSTQ